METGLQFFKEPCFDSWSDSYVNATLFKPSPFKGQRIPLWVSWFL